MALIPPPVDFTDKDFDSIKTRMENLIRSVFPDWTDFNVANFGNMLLESKAFILDVLAFYLDTQSRETRIGSVVQRKNMIALAKLINFELSSAAAATVGLDFSIPNTTAGDVPIPAGTIIRTRSVEPVVVQTLVDLTLLAGFTSVSGDAENSENQEEIFPSNGLADQEFLLGQTPYLDASAVIDAGGTDFIEVNNFINSTATDPHFTVTVDENDRATIRFGNGTNGLIPSGNITIAYKTGGGLIGNVDANTLNNLEGSFSDSLGNPVTLSVTNPLAASGGVNRQTVEQARVLAPESLRSINRTVSKDDYEIHARLVPGVARALMVTSNEDPGVGENTGDLIIIPEGGGVPTTTLKDQVLIQVTVTFPNTLTFLTVMVDPSFKTVTVDADVFLSAGANAATVKTAIETALAAFFAVSNADGTPNTNVDFGVNIKDATGAAALELAWSDVFNVVRDVAGVRKVDDDAFLLNGVADDVVLLPREFPVLGTITLVNGDTAAPL